MIIGGGDEQGDDGGGLYFWPIWVAILLSIPFVFEAVQRRRDRSDVRHK